MAIRVLRCLRCGGLFERATAHSRRCWKCAKEHDVELERMRRRGGRAVTKAGSPMPVHDGSKRRCVGCDVRFIGFGMQAYCRECHKTIRRESQSRYARSERGIAKRQENQRKGRQIRTGTGPIKRKKDSIGRRMQIYWLRKLGVTEPLCSWCKWNPIPLPKQKHCSRACYVARKKHERKRVDITKRANALRKSRERDSRRDKAHTAQMMAHRYASSVEARRKARANARKYYLLTKDRQSIGRAIRNVKSLVGGEITQSMEHLVAAAREIRSTLK